MDINTINDLRHRAEEIQNASERGENTAYRVGSLLKDMVDYAGEQSEEINSIDNIVVSLSNQNMPIGTDSEGSASYYSNSCKLEVFRNGIPMRYTSESTLRSDEYTYTIGTITRSDGALSTGITASAVNNKVVVSVSTIRNFSNVNAYIPLAILFSDGTTRDAVITLFGISTGKSGQIIDMYTSASAIHTDYYNQNVSPESIEVGVKIGENGEVNIYPSGDPVSSAESQGYSFTYYYNGETSEETSFVGTISPEAGEDYDTLTLCMYYNSQKIDTQTIVYVRDGAPGIGIDAITYRINVMSTTVTKSVADGVVESVAGEVVFTINRTEGDTTTEMQENPWSSSSSEVLSVKSNGRNARTEYQDGVWHVMVDIQNYDGTKPDCTQIMLKSTTNTLLASTVVPFIISTNNSTPVQEIGGVIIRFRRWEDLNGNADALGDVGIGVGVSSDSTVYKDIILYNGNYYYIAPTYSGSLDADTIYHGDLPSATGSYWVAVNPMSDAAFQTMIAKYGFIENLTAREIVVTTDENVPVAGMTRGAAVPGDGDAINGVERGDVRIWAGSPYKDTSSSLTNCPFYATNTGFVHAENAEIKGKVEATEGAIGGFVIGQDFIQSSSSNPKIQLKTDGSAIIGKMTVDTSGNVTINDLNAANGTFSGVIKANNGIALNTRLISSAGTTNLTFSDVLVTVYKESGDLTINLPSEPLPGQVIYIGVVSGSGQCWIKDPTGRVIRPGNWMSPKTQINIENQGTVMLVYNDKASPTDWWIISANGNVA